MINTKSHILESVSRLIFLFIIIFSIYLFLKGHNEPGGGFIAGIAASIPLILLAMSLGVPTVQRVLKIDSLSLAATGLILAYGTSFIPTLLGYPFLFQKMIHTHIPILGELHIGTPVLFDLGVFMVVVGVSTKIIFSFLETVNSKEKG
ncbi:Na(+)/H(+) antiporter subunit B [bacterium]|jgi:multisubunit Na+/H+ antiporter MnhB subunit|nr:Na(+)/H(+) antiporter subunit B [bacterium]